MNVDEAIAATAAYSVKRKEIRKALQDFIWKHAPNRDRTDLMISISAKTDMELAVWAELLIRNTKGGETHD